MTPRDLVIIVVFTYGESPTPPGFTPGSHPTAHPFPQSPQPQARALRPHSPITQWGPPGRPQPRSVAGVQGEECSEGNRMWPEMSCPQADNCFPGTPWRGEPSPHPPALRRVRLSRPRQLMPLRGTPLAARGKGTGQTVFLSPWGKVLRTPKRAQAAVPDRMWHLAGSCWPCPPPTPTGREGHPDLRGLPRDHT